MKFLNYALLIFAMLPLSSFALDFAENNRVFYRPLSFYTPLDVKQITSRSNDMLKYGKIREQLDPSVFISLLEIQKNIVNKSQARHCQESVYRWSYSCRAKKIDTVENMGIVNANPTMITSAYRYNNSVILLDEFNYVSAAGAVNIPKTLINTTLKGYPAIYLVFDIDSSRQIFSLSWVAGDLSYELNAFINKTDGRVKQTLFNLAEDSIDSQSNRIKN